MAATLVTALAAAACSSSNSGGVDGHVSDGAAHDSSGGDAAGSGCNGVYAKSTIKAMRMGTASSCFELDDVISIGTTSSATTPLLFVQDAAGGDYSAMMTKCSSTSTNHPCTVSAAVAAIADGHSVTVKGTYIKTAATTFEEFLVDSITDNGAGVAPAIATATVDQIARGSTAANLRFQHVSVSLTSITLKMYDWTPAEFANTTATKCTYQYGFGIIPSTVSVTEGAACAGSAAQPAGQASPNAAEILIGTDFYKTFTLSSDCRCDAQYSDPEPVAASTLGGSAGAMIGGMLVFDVPFGAGATGYYYLDPKVPGDAALSMQTTP